MRTILILVAMMLIMVGPSLALTIDINTCPDDGVGSIPLAENEFCQEMDVSNGPSFHVYEDGTVQYLGDPVDAPTATWFNYWTYTINPLTGGYVPGGIHKLDVVLQPCVEEPVVCDFTPLRPEKIEIYEPVEVGQQIEADYIRLPGNGAINSTVYLDGVESSDRIWNGESCIVVEALVNGVVYARDGIAV